MSDITAEQAAVIERGIDLLEKFARAWRDNLPLDTLTQTHTAALVAELRALLPQPDADAPECPNCHHKDNRHNYQECDDISCDCPFPKFALDAARALVAATAEAFLAGRPAERRVRVFNRGDDEPADHPKVKDADGDAWIKRPSGKWRIEANVKSGDPELDIRGQSRGTDWASLLLDFGPLTEVLDGGQS